MRGRQVAATTGAARREIAGPTARSRRAYQIVLMLSALAALTGCLPPPFSGVGQSGTVVVPRATGELSGLTGNVVTGSDGNLWYVTGDTMNRLTLAGQLTQFRLTGFCGSPRQLARGADGAMWLTILGCQGGQILRITTSGEMTAYNIPVFSHGASPQPEAITAGPDAAMWFTSGASVYRIASTGHVTAALNPKTGPLINITSITAGPDGALWFTREVANGEPPIGRLATSGAVRYFATPSIFVPTALVRGADGALWFGSISGQYGRITTDGNVRLFPAPKAPNGQPVTGLRASTVSQDGSVWFAADNALAVRVQPDGSAVTWAVAPDRQQTPRTADGIANTSDGSLWISTPDDHDLARMAAGGTLRSTIAVRGTDGGLWVQHNLNGQWIPLGGQLVGRPSVLAVNDTDYYFAVGSDGHPWVRTDALGWHRMSDTLRCELPVAGVWENQLNLFCGRVHDYITQLPGAGSLPTFVDGQTVLSLAQGPSYAIEAPALLGGLMGGAQAWATVQPGVGPLTTYTNRNPKVYWEATPLKCAHAPTGRVSGNTLYLACVNDANQLQYVTSVGGTGPWSAVQTVPVLTGTGNPGLVAVPDGSVLAILTNLDGSVTESHLTPTGGKLQATLSAWASPGVGADGP